MLGDGRVGVHCRIRDLIDYVKFYNKIIITLSTYPPRVRGVELRLVLKLMFRLRADIFGTRRGRALVELIV